MRALFLKLRTEEKQIEPYYNELNQFASIISQNKSLNDFLANPVFEQASKKGVVDKYNCQIEVIRHDSKFFKVAGG